MKFVFEVRIRPGHTAEQYADVWVRVSRIIQRQPGARGTRLHRKIGEPDVLLAIASWDSKDARDAATRALESHEAMHAMLRAEAAFVDVTILGEFEDPEWVVVPREE
ncbi:MAG: antibiotic biosynthesis monooxygenase family protein [Thermoanaerobaculia bacterium]